ncbi:hypothetical protein [Thiobacillus sp. 65-1402]|uniref:hypothetical protein n=1 Tax=Thiobacillus sp. 65-1402 TaxID=1895861 RepID=UPI000967BD57|nr:hypothetical protein [Thiobacillus sp. 65-1402]OJW81595.1 MAG: hypothetical protein BGO62_15465 [Thiobacillus sp. 65-1402]
MSVDRRFVLKSMVLGGAAGVVLSRSLPVLGAPLSRSAIRPALALVGSGVAEAAFLQGARAAVGTQLQVLQMDPGLGFMLDFEQRLRAGRSLRVIGLLDDAAATLVLDLARSAGARIPWLGHHTGEAGSTRHRLLNTDLAEGCARQLSRHLHACGAGFTLDEERQGSAAPARQLAGPARNGAGSAQWAAGVGYLLATLGTRPTMMPRVSVQGTLPSGSFVSFSIEV